MLGDAIFKGFMVNSNLHDTPKSEETWWTLTGDTTKPAPGVLKNNALTESLSVDTKIFCQGNLGSGFLSGNNKN